MCPPPVPLLRPASLPGTGFPPAGTGRTERRGQLERTGSQGRGTGVPAAPGGRCGPPLGAAGSAGEGPPGPSEAAGLRGSPRGFPGTVPCVPPSIPIPRPGPARAQSWQLLLREQGSPPPRTRTNLCRAAGSCLDARVPAPAGGDGSVSAARCPAAAQPGKHIPGQQQTPWAPPEPPGLGLERGLGRDPGCGDASSRPTALPQPLGTNIFTLGRQPWRPCRPWQLGDTKRSPTWTPARPAPWSPPASAPSQGLTLLSRPLAGSPCGCGQSGPAAWAHAGACGSLTSTGGGRPPPETALAPLWVRRRLWRGRTRSPQACPVRAKG